MRDMYQIERMNVDDAVIVDDKEHIIIVNGEYDGDDEIGRLMHDFKCENPDDMYYEILRNRVRYFKEDEGGRQEMCAIWEEIRNDGVIEGEIRGRIQGELEGKTKGKLENMISTLLKLLTKKFGKTITIELQTEIENSDIETLNEVTEVIFDVENEEDVLKILHHI
jgi:predicted transposase YdaD